MPLITQTCRISGIPFYVTDEDQAFYEKMGMPIPTLHPIERQKQRIRFRNFRNLYMRPSDMSGEMIISMYDEDSPYKVYSREEWWQDSWDAKEYGRDFDFSRSFFEQWHELNLAVPKIALLQYQNENCDYGNFVYKSRNCYMVFGCVGNEDCLYGHIVWRSSNCLDGLYIYECQWTYECTDCVGCYEVFYSEECVNCSEIYFSYDCLNCKNCFGCTNLRGKQWCFLNEQLSEEEYKNKLAEVMPLTQESVAEFSKKLEEMKRAAIHPSAFGTNNENVTGNHIYFSKNTYYGFDIKKCEDSKYLFTVGDYKDCYDMSFSPGKGELMYQCLAVAADGGGHYNVCCYDSLDSADIYYSDNCYSCKNCFGCSGLRNAQYCILNKQYSKEEYEIVKGRIIEHMKKTGEHGEFFPHEISPFAYNESVVQEYHPLTKDQVLSSGYRWKEKEEDVVSGEANQEVATCIVTGKRFKIISQELDFLKKFGLPLPNKHPDQRHLERMNLRNPRSLWPRKCAKCDIEIWSSYSPEKGEKVLCEPCYLGEVY